MATDILVGKKVEEVELLDLFPPAEGSIDQYYGRIGNGKTYAATADILKDLCNGEVVYCNWKINFSGFDQRESFWDVLGGIFALKKRYYKFRKENLHYIEIDDHFLDKLEKLNDCKIYLDEGHVIFDSYEKTRFSMRKRTVILHTRHFNRSIIIISQRPTAVHVSARANVNRFFKCEKLWSIGFNLFRKSEFQDMVNESVDEESDPISTKVYFGSKRIYNAYNSKYLRNGIPSSQQVQFDAYDVKYIDRWRLMLSLLGRTLKRAPNVPVDIPVDKAADNSILPF